MTDRNPLIASPLLALLGAASMATGYGMPSPVILLDDEEEARRRSLRRRIDALEERMWPASFIFPRRDAVTHIDTPKPLSKRAKRRARGKALENRRDA